jgi:hypothetical protein
MAIRPTKNLFIKKEFKVLRKEKGLPQSKVRTTENDIRIKY